MLMPQLSQAPKYLVPQCIEKSDGFGPVIELGTLSGKLLVVTLGINDVVEQEGLAISIWGSASGQDWGTKPILMFPQKYYCGVYATILNLTNNPNVRFLRVKWNMSRRANRNLDLMFGFYVALEETPEVSTAMA
jgi:hypothetical protein